MKLAAINNIIYFQEALIALYSYVTGTTECVGVCLNAHQCVSVTPFPDGKYGTGEYLQTQLCYSHSLCFRLGMEKNV